jgi:hypothetical protein
MCARNHGRQKRRDERWEAGDGSKYNRVTDLDNLGQTCLTVWMMLYRDTHKMAYNKFTVLSVKTWMETT